jgi:excinuclease ABC subunit C
VETALNIKYHTPASISQLPDQPGVYFFYNQAQEIIYVGKAKNLKKRVSSYFYQLKQANLKTKRMVSEIHFISFTITNSEYEALLLENTFIKKNQPPYNILLKDGSSYPYICITQERFPKVITTREPRHKLGKYYGPFTNLKAMYQILDLIKSLYSLRTCAYNLSEENIRRQKFKVCLEYHLKNCLGPCEGLQTEDNYNEEIDQIEYILKGNLSAVKKTFRDKMYQASKELAYKEAQDYKEKLEALEVYQAKSLVVNPQLGDLDVFGFIVEPNTAFVSYLQIKNGAITFAQTIEIKNKLEEAEEETLPLIILHFRELYHSTAPEVLSNKPITTAMNPCRITVPKIGDKKKLVDLSIKNALFLKKEGFLKKSEYQDKANKTLLLLQQDLQLKTLPLHIECFDNSNIQGHVPVAALVVFKNGKPAKKEYRHFNIKTVIGPNDFASMQEVVYRRYKRLLEERKPLPDLIVIDGGKGQLNAALQALKSLAIYGQVPVIGIAKRLEEIYYPDDAYPLHISKQSTSLKLLQQIRNEAHRFAISFHIHKRSKASLKSQLEDIPGIGPKTIAILLNHFQTIQNIQAAELVDLAAHIGQQKARKLKSALVMNNQNFLP